MNLNINQITLSWLNSVNGISNGKIRRLIEYFKTPEEIWNNLDSEKGNITEIKPETINFLLKTKDKFPDLLMKKLNDENASLVTYFDDKYPQKLKNIDGFPYILYYKGDLEVASSLSIAVVGSRKATSYGKFVAEKFTRELAELGVTIISGLAAGIDSVAHKTAIEHNTKTIGVTGCGINIVYPKKIESLYYEIINKGGTVITEFPFGMEPMPHNFPVRNRIISGLSNGVLVIEAQEKSGTLITSGHAANQGKEIFAVPGNIDSLYSKGTNSLIKDGAKIVTCIDDLVEEILELKSIVCDDKKKYSHIFNENELKIINLLKTGEKTIYEIAENTEIKVSTILSALTILEMKGGVKQMTGNKYYLSLQ